VFNEKGNVIVLILKKYSIVAKCSLGKMLFLVVQEVGDPVACLFQNSGGQRPLRM